MEAEVKLGRFRAWIQQIIFIAYGRLGNGYGK
jgi:hypothetical protein